MSKNLIGSALLTCLLLLLSTQQGLLAQTEDGAEGQETASSADAGDDTFSFAELGAERIVLQTGSQQSTIGLTIPAHWQLTEGAELVLDVNTLIHENNIPTNEVFGGWLLVEFNGVLLEEIPLEQNGTQTFQFTLPAEALTSEDGYGRYALKFSLQTNFGCNSNQDTTITVLPSSTVTLPHQIVAPPVDLNLLPYPIQQNSFLPDEAVLLLPDTPTAAELEAVLILASGLGRMMPNTNLILSTVGELTPELRDAHHIIAVGTEDNLPLLAQIPTPEETDANTAATTKLIGAAEPDDGLLRIAQSPWNEAKVILAVTAETEAGVAKAAQAIRYGTIRTVGEPDLAIIDDVYFTDPPSPLQTITRTFADLDYQIRTLNGPGMVDAAYSFFVKPGTAVIADETPTLTLKYSYSTLLHFEKSGFIVTLNGTPIGSGQFAPGNTAINTLQMELPENVLRPGDNTIRIRTELEPPDPCSSMREIGSWFNVHPESTLYLPLGPQPSTGTTPLFLSDYPLPHAFDANLATTAFILPQDDANAWRAAVKIATDLGRRIDGDLINLRVAFDTDVEATLREEKNLFIIGKASELETMTELNEHLPVPFAENQDRLDLDRLPVEYEIAPQLPLGYLQILTSPWNATRQIVTILGDSDEGVQNAAQRYLTGGRDLAGDLAIVEPEGTFTTNSPANRAAEEVGATDTGKVTELVTGESVEEEPTAEATEVADESTSNDDEEGRSEEETAVVATEPATTPENNTSNQSNTNARTSIPTLPLIVLAACVLGILIIGALIVRNRRHV